MSHITIFWIIGLAVLSACALMAQDRAKSAASNALILLASLFVVATVWTSVTSGSKTMKSSSLVDADKADILVRLQAAVETVSRSSSNRLLLEQRRNALQQTEELVNKALVKSPENVPVMARLAVVRKEEGKDIHAVLGGLNSMSTPEAKALADALKKLYGPGKVTASEGKQVKQVIDANLPEGWYKTAALFHLYKITKQNEAIGPLIREYDERNTNFLARFVFFVVIFGISFVVGIFVILIQLFFLPRRISSPEHTAQIASPAPYGFKTIYSVLLAWIATQLLVGLSLQSTLKSLHLMQYGVFVASLATAGFYILSNGPGLLYVYFLALKPKGMKFLDGICLKFKVERNGPVRLAFYGLFTWFAAVPIVVIAYVVANKYLGSEGSNNPIIALVMEAARSSNIFATMVFYLTLGFFAPFVEETIFRGFLYRGLRRYWSVFPSVVVSALVFAGVHLDLGGFLPLFCLGSLFAFVFERTRSIFPAMIAHGLWNSGTFSMVLLLFGN